ncbi:MAG TPA: SAM-dependent methyltransferase [Candidatus Saccharimonadales bacterium]|nr:SAM-dependent methyltransferase [Candidatus Saccharimonadales bacterium]
MTVNYKHLVPEILLNESIFVKAVLTGGVKQWTKVIIRPVMIKGKRNLQFSYFDKKKDITKNYFGNEANKMINHVLQEKFTNIMLHTTEKNIQIEIPKKGKAIIHEHTADIVPTIELAHDKQKSFVLSSEEPVPFLQAVGIMTQDGKIKADKQHKFKQINEFLKIISQSLPSRLQHNEKNLEIIDFGCGSGYLTLAVYYYFTEILKKQIHMTGVDIKRDVLTKLTQETKDLNWVDIAFEESSIIDFTSVDKADIVIALHACDTATDEALAKAIHMDSTMVFVSPCCHHNLQEKLQKTNIPFIFQPVFRHTILEERVGDILTDTFRALILQIVGYKTDVIEFISSEHTAKNLMIRAVKAEYPTIAKYIHEYKSLKNYWKVTPHLEKLLGRTFADLIK